MNEKEIAEIRRRFRPDKSNITHIRGCYVNDKREIVTGIDQSLAVMPQEESEKLLTILRRALSGTVGKNLVDIPFTTQQVVDSEEHRLLMALRDSALKDEEAVQAFFQRVIQSLTLEGGYLILLAADKYDVPYRSKDGERQDDASSEVYSYILCAVCPIKETKPALGYYVNENAFRSCRTDWIVGAPELGFLFPAFDDRSANIYGALYYSRDIAESHGEFVDAVFRREAPMPAAEQKETFQSILGETLAGECSYGVVRAVHDRLYEMVEEHKANKAEAPLVVSKQTVRRVLESCGVAEPQAAEFEEKFDAGFGADADVSPQNLVDVKRIEVGGATSNTAESVKACSRACEIIREKKAQHFCEFIVSGNAAIWAGCYSAAQLAGIKVGWMSYSAPSAYKSYLDPWANLDYSNFFAGGAEVSNPKYPLQSYLDAGVALSVYNADTDPEMTYVLKYYPKMKAVCTNYPAKLLGRIGSEGL